MKLTNLLIISTLSCFFFSTNAQNTFPTQTIRGEIRDADSGVFLQGATIGIQINQQLKGSVADEKGLFRLDSIPVGRYDLTVNFLGYETMIIPEIAIEAGKESIQNIWLKKSSESLTQVVVSGIGRNNRRTEKMSAHTLTVEETFRFPATFNDPARLAMSYPGVVGVDDQANGISVRGNSPATMQWRLEGVEIVNPNHLSNAGTSSDRPTNTSGGVNILSAQMLGTSSFQTGAFPVEYGNVLGGIMDMKLRAGNNEQREFTLKTGLTGLEFAAEGPFSKKSNASFLLNYRYSFVGVLTALGTDFGGEKITFQDLSIHLNLPTKKAGTFSFFGTGGQSENIFEKPDSATIEKELLNIRFDSKMAAIGLKHEMAFKNSFWTSTAVFSQAENNYLTDFPVSPSLVFEDLESDNFTRQKISFLTQIQRGFSKGKIKYGLGMTTEAADFSSSIGIGATNPPVFFRGGDEQNFIFRPFVGWAAQLSSKNEMKIGLATPYFSQPETFYFEPNFELSHQFSTNQKLSLKSSLHSQYFFHELFSIENNGLRLNPDLQPSRSWHSVLAFRNQSKSGTVFQSEIYYQMLFNLPVSNNEMGSYSAINHAEGVDWMLQNLENGGTGTNVGLDLSLQKFLTKKLYFLVAGSLYNSTYKAKNVVKRNTRFNGNYVLNLTAGREFLKKKKAKSRTFGVNVRTVLAGGMRVTPITNFQVDPNSPNAFSNQLKDFFRMDLRGYFKWNRANRTSILAIDIQNATNRKNEAYFYHDLVKDAVVLKEQLGLIPNLTYQLDF